MDEFPLLIPLLCVLFFSPSNAVWLPPGRSTCFQACCILLCVLFALVWFWLCFLVVFCLLVWFPLFQVVVFVHLVSCSDSSLDYRSTTSTFVAIDVDSKPRWHSLCFVSPALGTTESTLRSGHCLSSKLHSLHLSILLQETYSLLVVDSTGVPNWSAVDSQRITHPWYTACNLLLQDPALHAHLRESPLMVLKGLARLSRIPRQGKSEPPLRANPRRRRKQTMRICPEEPWCPPIPNALDDSTEMEIKGAADKLATMPTSS